MKTTALQLQMPSLLLFTHLFLRMNKKNDKYMTHEGNPRHYRYINTIYNAADREIIIIKKRNCHLHSVADLR